MDFRGCREPLSTLNLGTPWSALVVKDVPECSMEEGQVCKQTCYWENSKADVGGTAERDGEASVGGLLKGKAGFCP
jgi:hypothetical protein